MEHENEIVGEDYGKDNFTLLLTLMDFENIQFYITYFKLFLY